MCVGTQLLSALGGAIDRYGDAREAFRTLGGDRDAQPAFFLGQTSREGPDPEGFGEGRILPQSRKQHARAGSARDTVIQAGTYKRHTFLYNYVHFLYGVHII